MTSYFRPHVEIMPFHACVTKMAEILAFYRKSGDGRKSTTTSDFRPDVEIWPFRACAMKNMNYNRRSHCELGYGADAMFYKMYFYYLVNKMSGAATFFSVDSRYIATYKSLTRGKQSCAISEVTADWH